MNPRELPLGHTIRVPDFPEVDEEEDDDYYSNSGEEGEEQHD
jgi:hypothetical protein